MDTVKSVSSVASAVILTSCAIMMVKEVISIFKTNTVETDKD